MKSLDTIRSFVLKIASEPASAIGLVTLALLLVLAIVGPWIAPQNPYDLSQISLLDNVLPPGESLSNGRIAWLGTDEQGRDLLSTLLYGLRISLGVGAISVTVACIIGVIVGISAAYIGGRIENVIMRLVDIQLSLPAILVALVLLGAFGRGVDKVILALIIVQWAYFARAARGSAVVERNKEYVEAARCLAFPEWRIVFKHILPNCMPIILVIATVDFARAISLEATLSFLGVGVPVTEPSLGSLINNGYNFMLSGKYWMTVFPGVLLLIIVFSINVIGDRLRDILNPRLGERRS